MFKYSSRTISKPRPPGNLVTGTPALSLMVAYTYWSPAEPGFSLRTPRLLILCRTMAPTLDRKSQLVAAATAYFAGLASKDFASVPWAETIVFRGPLSPGGVESPLVGRDSALAFFNALGPKLGEVRILTHFLNEDLTAIITKAEVSVLEPTCVLRVADLFEVDTEGRITAQENHYDPRPALG
jgi:hypothetical protein